MSNLKRIFKKFFKNLFIFKLKAVFSYEKKEKYNKALVFGGHKYSKSGKHNVGDEAQLNQTMRELEEEFPNYVFKVMTPNEYYTQKYNKRYNMCESSRTAFFDEGEGFVYTTKYLETSYIMKLLFILKTFGLMLNAYLVRAGLPTIFISAKKSALLYEIYRSDFVYFSGGGYLTGRTISRLYDGLSVVAIAEIFKVPCYMSGQQIGVFPTFLDKALAKKYLNKVKLIGIRNEEYTVDSLNEIGVNKPKLIKTHDDALFCEKCDGKDAILTDFGISEKDMKNGYVIFQFHYFREKNDGKFLEDINYKIEQALKKFEKPVYLLSMSPTDEQPIEDYMNKYKNSRVKKLNYIYDFKQIRTVLSYAEIAITMKHHPMIFALGETVPVINIIYSDYYVQKNVGALKVFGLENYCINLEKEWRVKYNELLDELHEKRDQISLRLQVVLPGINDKKKLFYKEFKNLIGEVNG